MDDTPGRLPRPLVGILAEAARIGFAMSCEHRTGALLSTLAAAKRGGLIVELGTGIGAGTAWLLDGMDADARLVTVEADSGRQAVARRHIGDDPRVAFVHDDAERWLRTYEGPRFDLAFVDCRPGKFTGLDRLVRLLRPGALYVGDDLNPQPTWPDDHQARVDRFLREMPRHTRMRWTLMDWASGLAVAARLGDEPYPG
ncbi:O-methyltransferase [Streptomyces sp. NPDC090025]|uniref:O-methyltransferase n=1 Tax=Streptomyces sp. NPDC090025 TaxID=3365922 RepID=UPI003833DE60